MLRKGIVINFVLTTALLSTNSWAESAQPGQSLRHKNASKFHKREAQKESLEVIGNKVRKDPQRATSSSYHFSGKELVSQRINTLEDLQQLAPSLNIDAADPFNSSISIRGMGDGGGQTGGETNVGMPSSVGLFLDGVYLSRPSMMSHGFNDLESIDVYNGATQGTLYPANVTAGVIDIKTRMPSATPRNEALFSYGSYGYMQASALTSGRILKNLFGSISYNHTAQGGFIKNVRYGNNVNGYHGDSVRVQLAYRPGKRFHFRLIADYSAERETPTPVFYKSITVDGKNEFQDMSSKFGNHIVTGRKTDIDYQNYDTTQQFGVSPQLSWRFAGGWKFSSISSFRYFDTNPVMADPYSINVYYNSGTNVRDRTWYENLRFDSPQWKTINFAAGFAYSGESLNTNAITRYSADSAGAWYGNKLYNGLDVYRYGSLRDDYYSFYAQATAHPIKKVTMKFGFREGIDDKSGTFRRLNKSPFYSGVLSKTTALPSAMVNIDYDPDSLTKFYVALAYGMKAGALNISSGSAGKAGFGSLYIKPETTESIEVGLHKEIPVARLDFKIDYFNALVKNFQTQGYDPTTQQTYLTNAGDYRSRGIEYTMNWHPLKGLMITPNILYNDTKYLTYDNARCMPEVSMQSQPPKSCSLNGKPVFRAPKLSLSVLGRYDYTLNDTSSVYATVRYSYRTATFATVDDSPSAKIPAYGLLNFSLGYKIKVHNTAIDTSVWVNNVLNKTYYRSLREGDYGSVFGWLGTPRIIGGTVSVHF
ncbi:TonB-dependent receptor [Acetobacter thailandicus]|uniref:TonB-dependent receptor n=1 Tax=Acetobacter thailandicus TaxID=1502842 RepID=UPI001BADB5A7|nr:TonB-dependent receptor plug domain-containing protein [Acetobacter thailandicus]MBS0960939.1 TonB-dependent receptor plug domain-containing protein [Acetobacter thailandicus]